MRPARVREGDVRPMGATALPREVETSLVLRLHPVPYLVGAALWCVVGLVVWVVW